MNKRFMVLKDKEGKFSIVPLSVNERHPHMVCVAPHGFEPGDEKYISLSKEGRVLFDYSQKHLAERKALEPVRKRAKAEKWNQMSVVQRIKSSFKA